MEDKIEPKECANCEHEFTLYEKTMYAGRGHYLCRECAAEAGLTRQQSRHIERQENKHEGKEKHGTV